MPAGTGGVEGATMHAKTLLLDRVNKVLGEGGAGAISTRTAPLPNRAQCRCASELAICGCRALWMIVIVGSSVLNGATREGRQHGRPDHRYPQAYSHGSFQPAA
jgi:hypothetical protein